MHLLIISHTEHYFHEGRFYGWGPTIREIDHLASLYERVTHLAFCYPEPPPSSALPYTAANVSVVPLQPSGGATLGAKLGVLLALPGYLWKISRALRQADAVHVRCPANVSLLAVILLAFRRQPQIRWFKYAGNWQPEGKEAWSYAFQRWWLAQRFSGGLVTVNGNWPGQPAHVRAFYNPCMEEQELQQAAARAAQKQMQQPLRLVFAGRVESAKGIPAALDVVAQLQRDGIPARLDLAGDGPERPAFEKMAVEMGLQEVVRFHGWLPHTAMGSLYRDAHLMLLPTVSEGWPKVLSEAMAHGVVPVASDVSSIGQYLRTFSVGRFPQPGQLTAFVEAARFYARNPRRWKEESERAAAAAGHFTYEAYLSAVSELLGESVAPSALARGAARSLQ